MRKLFLYMTMSMDGFIAGPDNELDWMIGRPDQELNDDIAALLTAADTRIIGYPAAEEMISFWEGVESGESASQVGLGLAKVINRIHTVVLSNADVELNFNDSELMVVKNDQNLVEAVTQLKQQFGKDIIVRGGVRTAQKFARLGLAEEFVLMVHPIALGSGKALFTTKIDLELVSSKMYASGVLRLRYQPKNLGFSDLISTVDRGNIQV
jgi:dihydrofolate reductase